MEFYEPINLGEASLPSNDESKKSSEHKRETMFFVLGGIVMVTIILILGWIVFRKRVKRSPNPVGKTVPNEGSFEKFV